MRSARPGLTARRRLPRRRRRDLCPAGRNVPAGRGRRPDRGAVRPLSGGARVPAGRPADACQRLLGRHGDGGWSARAAPSRRVLDVTADLRDVDEKTRVTPARVAVELGLWSGRDQRLSWDGLLDLAVQLYWRSGAGSRVRSGPAPSGTALLHDHLPGRAERGMPQPQGPIETAPVPLDLRGRAGVRPPSLASADISPAVLWASAGSGRSECPSG